MDGIFNAKITGTMLGFEDHGIFTFMVHCDGEFGSVGFGGYTVGNLDSHVEDQTVFGPTLIARILKCADVEQWEKLIGRPVRVRLEGNRCVDLGHFLKQDWVFPSHLAKRFWGSDVKV